MCVSNLRYISLFSGIEAATVAWHPLGWECVAVAEIDKFPSRVLNHYYPKVPNLGDITKITEHQIMMLGRVDAAVFGSPCQDLSVAGKRKGLNGERSGLFHDAMRVIRWLREWCDLRYALWENVPGAFTSNKGADFAVVVGEMAGMDAIVPPKGWGTEGVCVGEEAMVEWATLDAQWFGVAQRRRRVFALADFGDWTSRPPILLEPESLRGDSAPSRGAGEDVAGTLAARTAGGGYPGTDEALGGHVVPARASGHLSTSTGEIAHCLNAGGMKRIDFETETMIAYMPARTFGSDGGIDEHFGERDVCDALHTRSGSGNKAPMVVCATGDVTHTLKAEDFDASEDGTGRGTPIIAFNSNAQPDQMTFDEHLSAPLTTSQYSAVSSRWGVRRLTPLECERLQAFPDQYTNIPGAADGPRYKALGNSMCVNVMHWIGQRIDLVHRFF